MGRLLCSKVKERDRSRSSSRSRSRHRSTSPSSVRTNSPPAMPSVPLPPPLSEPSSAGGSHLQVRLDAAKGEITRLLNERREQEREAQQQLVTLNARLAEKEQQMNRLAGILEATKAESQRQLNDIRYYYPLNCSFFFLFLIVFFLFVSEICWIRKRRSSRRCETNLQTGVPRTLNYVIV